MVSGLQLFNPIVRKKYFIFWRSRLPMLLFLLLMLLLSMLLLSLLLLLPSFCRTNKNQTEKNILQKKNQNLTFKAEHFFVQISYFPRRELDTILWHQSKVLLDSFWKKNLTPHNPPPISSRYDPLSLSLPTWIRVWVSHWWRWGLYLLSKIKENKERESVCLFEER